MAYTPNEWSTGDTITAAKLNNMENGIANAGSVATVCVDFNSADTPIDGSVAIFITYARSVQGYSAMSEEAFRTEYYSSAPYNGIFYVPVPIPPPGDEFKAYVAFSEYINSMAAYTVSGGISSNKVELHRRTNATTWESGTLYGFEISGDGKIVVSYFD